MLNIIFISGLKFAGKSYLADLLAEDFSSLNLFRVAFADDVKKIATDVFNWDGKKDTKGRKLLQAVGDAGRASDINFWVKRVDKKILNFKNKLNPHDLGLVLIDDWRYNNEFDSLNHSDYLKTKIRVFKDISEESSVDGTENHSSENDLPEDKSSPFYDYTFINTKSKNRSSIKSSKEYKSLLKLIKLKLNYADV